MSTPTAAGMMAPFVGMTESDGAPDPEVDVRHDRHVRTHEGHRGYAVQLCARIVVEAHAGRPVLERNVEVVIDLHHRFTGGIVPRAWFFSYAAMSPTCSRGELTHSRMYPPG